MSKSNSTGRSDFLAVATERGFVHQCTDLEALDARLHTGPATAYLGYDCTADSLHVGHLLGIMLLRLYQKSGHKPIALIGGGTTKIGDPSFRDEARPLLTDTEIARNIAGIRQTFAKFLTFGEGPTDAIMVNNADWLDELKYIPLLRDIGRHFSVNRMLTQESVKLRLDREQPLSFLEFNYPILQAYDFVELSRRFGCELQIGGSDQWGNIVAGVELGRRVEGKALFGLTTPLLTTTAGAKMGKTAAGAVWLNADRLSPYDYWQFWRNTELPLGEIARLEKLRDAEINEAKKVLATEATALPHGRAAAHAVAETAREVFEAGGAGGELPQLTVPRDALQRGMPAFELFVRARLASSNGEARRLIKGGGARVNDKPVPGELHPVSLADLDAEGRIKLSAGKKRHALVFPD